MLKENIKSAISLMRNALTILEKDNLVSWHLSITEHVPKKVVKSKKRKK